MPYIRKWLPPVTAIEYVMRAEKCDRAVAMRQIEAAALDGALRWVRGGSNRWDWDAEVFRADLRKLWPVSPANVDAGAQLDSSTTLSGAKPALLNSGDNRHWKPLNGAVDTVMSRGIPADRAWAAIKEDIATGELNAHCRTRRYDQQQAQWIDIRRDLDPRWLSFIAYEFPQDNHLRFDPAAAGRARRLGEQVDPPPEHARDIAVDAVRLDELYPPASEENPSPPSANDAGVPIVGPDADKGSGRKPVVRRPSRQKPFWLDASKVAFDWLDDNGYPVPGDGGQAKLETHITGWLTERGFAASESTIRKYVKTWIEEYKTSLSVPP